MMGYQQISGSVRFWFLEALTNLWY